MFSLIAIFLVLTPNVPTIVGANSFNGEVRTNLSVYYETLCPDSIHFVRQQLKPLMTSKIGKYVTLELVPYGKAKTRGSKANPEFKCQHGQEECQGNIIQSCALKIYQLEDAQKFVLCTMNKKYPPNEGESCSKKLGLSYAAVKECSNSLDGRNYLVENGRKTHDLKPKLNFVPWIVFNNSWDQGKMDRSLKDLKAVVCEEIGIEQCN